MQLVSRANADISLPSDFWNESFLANEVQTNYWSFRWFSERPYFM